MVPEIGEDIGRTLSKVFYNFRCFFLTPDYTRPSITVLQSTQAGGEREGCLGELVTYFCLLGALI